MQNQRDVPAEEGVELEIRGRQLRVAVSALALAFVVFYFVVFAPGVFHNAAHDLRHAFSVPCH